jgi:hypothetical protein
MRKSSIVQLLFALCIIATVACRVSQEQTYKLQKSEYIKTKFWEPRREIVSGGDTLITNKDSVYIITAFTRDTTVVMLRRQL